MSYTLETEGKILEATEEQAAIIDHALANPQGSLLINALAGAAKTSTLQFLGKYLPPIPTLSLAFNKRIADKMAQVLPAHIKSSTVNSVGHRVWGAVICKRLTLDTKKNYNLVKDIIDSLPRGQRNRAYDNMGDLMKTVSKAKLSGYVPSAIVAGKSLIAADDFFGNLEDGEPDDWFQIIVNEALGRGIKQAYGGLIDFDDQIYMSTLFGGSFPYFPRVLVDEAQDLSRLNHAMLERLVTQGTTQLIAVGDPWQSIYAFRGADTLSMTRLKEQYSMTEMTLSVSFRCPIRVVENAHWRVPHMKWPSWAAEGRVEHLESLNAHAIPDNSAIICRNNAPLLTIALMLLREGRGVHLVGTDLGPQLLRALKKLSDDTQLPQPQVYEAINAWEQEKLRRARDSGIITDKAECLRVFAGFGPTLGAAIAYCERLFSAQGPIQLLSGHKAKGLEWDTVYHLDPQRVPSPWAKTDEAIEQELNIRYVIETRAKRSLFFVKLENFTGDTE
jgi:hypothetical protein